MIRSFKTWLCYFICYNIITNSWNIRSLCSIFLLKIMLKIGVKTNKRVLSYQRTWINSRPIFLFLFWRIVIISWAKTHPGKPNQIHGDIDTYVAHLRRSTARSISVLADDGCAGAPPSHSALDGPLSLMTVYH